MLLFVRGFEETEALNVANEDTIKNVKVSHFKILLK